MITYDDVFNIIKAALSMRTPGTQVQVADHEAAEIKILDYIEQNKGALAIIEAHAVSVAGVHCDLVWSSAYTTNDYTFTVQGWGASGTPVEVVLISKLPAKIIVMTFEPAGLNAISRHYNE